MKQIHTRQCPKAKPDGTKMAIKFIQTTNIRLVCEAYALVDDYHEGEKLLAFAAAYNPGCCTPHNVAFDYTIVSQTIELPTVGAYKL